MRTASIRNSPGGFPPIPFLPRWYDGILEHSIEAVLPAPRGWKLPTWVDCVPEPFRKVAYCLVGLSILSLAALPGQSFLPFSRDPRMELAIVLGPTRPSEGLFTGFDYAPYRGSARPALHPSDFERLKSVLQSIPKKLNERSPEDFAILAVAELIGGNLDRAVSGLTHALHRYRDEAALWSDLSALYLAKAEAEQHPTDVLESVAAALKAVELKPDLREARFNFALTLERFSLDNQARAGWNAYLKLDPDSPWAQEAEDHLRALAQPPNEEWDPRALETVCLGDRQPTAGALDLVAQYRQPARFYAEKNLLAVWAEEREAGRLQDSARSLAVARCIGAALAAVNGDHMVEDSVAVIDAALADAAHPERIAALVAGHRLYGEGLQLGELDAPALPKFEQAARSLRVAGSPFAARAQVRAASCEGYLGRQDAVLSRLGPVQEQIDGERYPNLAGDLLWMLARARSRKADFSGAIDAFSAALADFSRTGEPENVAFLHYLIAECLRYLGDTQQAWAHRYEGLRASRTIPRSTWYHNTLLDSAEAALSQGKPELALLFQNEMVTGAFSTADPVLIAESLLRRSRTRCQIEGLAAAELDFGKARLWLARIASPERRDFLASELNATEGECRTGSDPDHAAQLLSSAMTYAEGHGDHYRLPKLYARRAAAFVAAGLPDAAEHDLETGLREVEEQRAQIAEGPLRISYLDQAQGLFDDMIRFQIQTRNRWDLALEYSEKSRSRTLLDAIEAASASSAPDGEPALSVTEIRSRLPEGVALVEYSLASQSLFIWIVSRESFDGIEIPIDEDRLQAHVRLFRSALTQRSDKEAAKLSTALYEVLVRPALDKAGLQRSLILIPDKLLHQVPFAALLDPKTGRYLAEDRRIAFAPSAAVFLHALERSGKLAKRAASGALILGDPTLDPQISRDFPDLPGARGEVAQIAKLWQTEPVHGERASRSAFLEEAPRHWLVHVAGHARSNPRDPLSSSLLLAPEGSDRGELSARDIYSMQFTETRLVVLAACGTAGGPISTSEGSQSLVQPFLAAGVPAVLGSLWPIEDRTAEELFTRFYRRVAAGADFVTALHETQNSFIHDPDPELRRPGAWSGFQLVGGVATPAGN
jgi:CHAT domain-containing protein